MYACLLLRNLQGQVTVSEPARQFRSPLEFPVFHNDSGSTKKSLIALELEWRSLSLLYLILVDNVATSSIHPYFFVNEFSSSFGTLPDASLAYSPATCDAHERHFRIAEEVSETSQFFGSPKFLPKLEAESPIHEGR